MTTKKLRSFAAVLEEQIHLLVVAAGIPGLIEKDFDLAVSASDKDRAYYTFRMGWGGTEIHLTVDCKRKTNEEWIGQAQVSWPSTYMKGAQLHAFAYTLNQVAGLCAQLQALMDFDGPYAIP